MNEKAIIFTKEEIETIREIYHDIETNYKIRTVTSAIYKIDDPLKDKAYREMTVINKILLFLRSPHA